MKINRILPVLSALWMGASAFAQSDVLTFSGNCSLSLNGQAYVTIDSFDLEAKEGDCPNKTMEFSVPGNGQATKYGIYVEFQRSEFGPGLRDKPYFGYYEKSQGTLKNTTRAYNVKEGTVLIFSQELKDGARLHCSGTVK
jgi:hypothetical protein